MRHWETLIQYTTSVHIHNIRDRAWTGNSWLIAQPTSSDSFSGIDTTQADEEHLFFLQHLFLKCISLPMGSPLPPSSSHTPLRHVLWFLLQALGSLRFTLPFHDTAEREEKCKARDPSCRKSTGVRWEQSTLSRTALVGQWWGLSNGTTLSPSSPSPCCLCPQYGSRKHL